MLLTKYNFINQNTAFIINYLPHILSIPSIDKIMNHYKHNIS